MDEKILIWIDIMIKGFALINDIRMANQINRK